MALIHGVSTTDPLTIAGVPLTLAVAGLACDLPARWATKVDPRVLREE